ncbi:SDR family NAD(P)-dependent oxidoreductase [Jiangella muralis]|uniref:SDR family NAD(P)-dependent oxidoreductase n=1 Tax=Jiangella muralis TaxID=702383 RepID=UPI0009FA8512|nr:SDR family oxidoreductase [Jiangella muralis]
MRERATDGSGGRSSGPVAIVTGGGRGIGRAVVLRLVQHGWRCVIAGLDDDDLRSTADEAATLGWPIATVTCDIATDHGRSAVAETWAVVSGGRLDMLVNCAARCTAMPLFSQSTEDWSGELNTNLVAVAVLSAWAIERMKPHRTGCVVNVGSVYGSLGLNTEYYAGVYSTDGPSGPVRAPAYHASKGGVAALTRELAVAAGPWNIRANTVSPGMIDTPERSFAADRIAGFARATPLQRMGEPDEVAAVVEFLASDVAAFITGTEIVVDGGWSVW